MKRVPASRRPHLTQRASIGTQREALHRMTSTNDSATHLLRDAADRLRSISSVVTLLTELLPGADDSVKLRDERDRLERDLNAILLLSQVERGAALARLTPALTDLAVATEQFDARIPISWFRENFAAMELSTTALANYASLLVRYVGDNLGRLDRIEMVLTRLVAGFVRADEPNALATSRHLLSEILPPVTLDLETRDVALTMLKQSAERAREFTSYREMMESNFLTDVRGYKLMLGKKLLEPQIMASALELYEIISEKLRRLASIEAPDGKKLYEHLAEVDQRVETLFRRVRDEELTAQLKAQQELRAAAEKKERDELAAEKARKKRKASEYRPPQPVSHSARRFRALAVIAVAAAAFALILGRSPSQIAPLSQLDVHALSPLFISGSVAPADHPRAFVGHIDPDQWERLTLAERKRAAETIAHALSERHLAAGTVLAESRVAIQIERGQLLVIQ
jgi:hypothetical protein